MHREGGHSQDQEVRDGERHWPRKGELPPTRRHLLAPTLLGRAIPRVLRQRHTKDGARGVPTGGTARDNRIQANRRRRATIGKGKEMGLGHSGQESGGKRQDRQQDRFPSRPIHHAWICRKLSLLPALHGSTRRQGSRLQGRGRILEAR